MPLCALLMSKEVALPNEQMNKPRDQNTKSEEEKIRLFLWNIEGLKNAISQIPENTFDTYNAVALV